MLPFKRPQLSRCASKPAPLSRSPALSCCCLAIRAGFYRPLFETALEGFKGGQGDSEVSKGLVRRFASLDSLMVML
jgi:hypothetical protein